MMKSSLSPLLAALLLLVSCGPRYATGDLLFLRGEGGMSDAVSASTGEITHVGIVLCTDSGTFVVDATPSRGVALTPLKDFPRPHERVPLPYPCDTARLRACLGCPYDSAFLPDNQAYYCSELVQQCYPMVPSQPMRFRDAAGHLPPFWADWFARLGCPVPEGLPGTNPSDLYLWLTGL